ncbi:MAG TPA: transglycosylase domain-containing protein [Dehalococcoidia bacterium]|nr:transglycosylase domain-containing protein [Dehalococcoidia bacterium]
MSFVTYRSYADDLKSPEEAIADSTIGTSLAYDRAGVTLLYQYVDPLGGLKEPVPLSEMSPYMIGATIATEDASFYGNPGVNFRGLARAAVENLTPFGPGFLEGSGGSSITQQLVKNIYIDRSERFDRRVERKIKETVIALELKRKYDDNQILEWYLNTIDYANFAFGAEAAAERYFGKSSKDLTLGEAALLAGLPQAPGQYTPAIPENRDAAKARQMEVLDLMIKHLDEVNAIPNSADPSQPLLQLTEEQVEAAKLEPLNYIDNAYDIKTPHFVLLVQDQVTRMCQAGLFKAPGKIPCDKVVTQGGLRIQTTIDLGLQDIGQRIVEENIAANEARYGGHDGSLVAMRPGTGEILAYIGSRDYNRDDIAGKVDIATSLQSHGSTMKMFTYLTAFEQGWVPSTYIQDAPLFLEAAGGKKQVNNWNFSHQGNITVRKALSESVNTTAVRTVMEVGMDEMRDMAHRLGITDLRQGDCGPTITLGACEVQLLDMTLAVSTLANNGVMRGRPTSEDLPAGYREIDPVSVLKIDDAEGNVLYQFSNPTELQVVDPAYAYMLTNVLSKDAINWSRLTIDRPAASKTGTSEDFRDGVVMGYTPDLAAGVWMGNADNTAMAPGTFSSAGTGPMWRQFMKEAHAYLQLPPRDFEKPADVVTTTCGGREELFKRDQVPSKPGACRAPAPSSGGSSSTPSPPTPKFPSRNTPTPTPTPTPEPTPSPTPTTEPGTPSPVLFYYTVKQGDTLEHLANRFKTTVAAIVMFNEIDPEEPLQVGTVLAIPLGFEG